MFMSDIMSISLALIAGIVVIVLLMWKNKNDKKLLNPDAQDAVEEAMMDNELKKDSI